MINGGKHEYSFTQEDLYPSRICPKVYLHLFSYFGTGYQETIQGANKFSVITHEEYDKYMQTLHRLHAESPDASRHQSAHDAWRKRPFPAGYDSEYTPMANITAHMFPDEHVNPFSRLPLLRNLQVPSHQADRRSHQPRCRC